MLSIKTILHPTDFSEPSEYAFQMACSLASDDQAQLVIVHVIQSPIVFGAGVETATTGFQDDLMEELSKLDVPDEQVRVVRQLEEGREDDFLERAIGGVCSLKMDPRSDRKSV